MVSPREHLELRRAVTRFLDRVQALPGWQDALAALPATPEAAAEMSFSALKWEITGQRPSEPPLDPAVLRELGAYDQALAKFAKRYLCDTVWGPHAIHDARRLRRRLLLPEGRDQWVQLAERFEASLSFEAGQPYPASSVLDAADGLRASADALEAANVTPGAGRRPYHVRGTLLRHPAVVPSATSFAFQLVAERLR